MKGKKRAILLFIISLLSLVNLYSISVKENDVTIAIQSIVVAAASVHGLTLLTPPQGVEHASFTRNGSSSEVLLTLKESDIGLLKNQFLNFPSPIEEPKGFFEMLLTSVTSFFPSYEFISMYLRNQHLSEKEVVLTGTLSAMRKARTYPFRYEGVGAFQVEGNRVSTPFFLEFSFIIPLEGDMKGEIVPTKVLVDGEDALDIASRVFYID